MTTVADIITRAFRKIGVAADDEALTASQMQAGLDAYNDMLHGWSLRGVNLSHVDQGTSDQFFMGDEFREGTVYLLAERLSPDYTVPRSFDTQMWFDDFRRAYTDTPKVKMPNAISRMPSRYWRNSRVR